MKTKKRTKRLPGNLPAVIERDLEASGRLRAQADFLRRRFNLTPGRAVLIAALAFATAEGASR